MGILKKIKRCCLQLENLKKLIFVNKNWPSDFKVDCEPPSNLVELKKKYRFKGGVIKGV
jgi:hypothetical protein